MMQRRDLESIDGGINGLHRPWVAADVLVETIEVSEERVREDILLRTAAKQERFDFGAPLRSCRTERRYEDERLDRRRLVHIDPRVQKQLDDRLASAEHGELQETCGMRRGDEDVRRALHQSTQRRGIPAPGEGDRLDRRLVTQARTVRSRAQRRRHRSLVDQRHRQDPDLVLDSAARLDVRHRRVERVAEMPEPLFGERAGDGQQIVAMMERQVGAVAVARIAAEPLGEEALLRLALVGEIAVEERPQHGVGLDAVIEPVDERFDRGTASDAPEEIATDEGAVRLWVGKKSTVLHRALAFGRCSDREVSYLFTVFGSSRRLELR